eukprot:scaffold206_cov54-Attheya_sp.AAC.1
MITRQLTQQISIGATRAATKFISHDPPTRMLRPRKAQKGMGGPPLSRLLTGQAMVSDTTTRFNYENSATRGHL